MKLFAAACGLAVLAHSVGAIHLQISGKRRADSDPPHRLSRRASISGSSPLSDSADVSYYTNVSIGGEFFSCLIDTGSSDLWVAGTVWNSQDAGYNSGVTYAVGSVTGPVKLASLIWANHSVPNQAFIQVTPDSQNPSGTGLIGLGPSAGSNILHDSGGDPNADPVLDRIFRQDRSTLNFLSVLLGRSNDPSDLFPGDITVGELLPGYEAVANEPKLPVTIVPVFEVGDQHWQILLDQNGIIGPNGLITVTTAVSGTKNQYQATAILDTGFSLPQVPKAVSDAIYGQVTGAQYTNINGIGNIWVVPCDQEINLGFRIGGVLIPIHPLDVSLDAASLGLSLTDTSTGKPFCLGAFQPVSFNAGSSPTFDIILGMAFLRNTYALFDFGDFLQGTFNTAAPYVQLLPTTNDTAAAHQDFVKVRLNGTDNGHVPLAPNAGASSTPSGSASGATANNSVSSKLGNKNIWWIVAAATGGAAALLLLLGLFLRRRRANKTFARAGGITRVGGGWTSNSYAPLADPAPVVDHGLAQPYGGGTGGGYSGGGGYGGGGYSDGGVGAPASYQPGGQTYETPYDRR